MENEINTKITKLISNQLNLKNNVSLDDNFKNLGVDEVDYIEILMRTEDLFGIEISDEEANNILTINDLVNCIKKNLT